VDVVAETKKEGGRRESSGAGTEETVRSYVKKVPGSWNQGGSWAEGAEPTFPLDLSEEER